ncbi:MAG: class I SAM-dependent methyltransferase [Pseudomonadota bacterium]
MTATDWDAYYRKPAAATSITRKISSAKISQCLSPYLKEEKRSICELGGANSCFANDFLKKTNVGSYHVIDLNQLGVGLLKERFLNDSRVSAKVANVLDLSENPTFDIVYSVGLIEHFDVAGTAACIEAHFRMCKPDGMVLITFPTPTPPYRLIRATAKLARMWRFHDERPLGFEEVIAVGDKFGFLKHRSINWAIGLTQGYVLYQKR